MIGIADLGSHDLDQRYFPNLFPHSVWSARIALHKWTYVGIDALGLFILLATLFMSVIWTAVAFANSKIANDQGECWIDLCFVGALYLTLFLL